VTGEYEGLEDVDNAPEWVDSENEGRGGGEAVAKAHCLVPRSRTNKMKGGRMDTIQWGQ
jgi:hypothetical protein